VYSSLFTCTVFSKILHAILVITTMIFISLGLRRRLKGYSLCVRSFDVYSALGVLTLCGCGQCHQCRRGA
jgi:hypothetical protein